MIMVIRLRVDTHMPAKRARRCLGSVSMPSDRAKVMKPAPRNIWANRMTRAPLILDALDAAMCRGIRRSPAMEKMKKRI